MTNTVPFTEKERGLTLIEVLVALMLLLVVSTVIVDLFARSSQQLQDARRREVAMGIAIQRMDQLRSMSFYDLYNNFPAWTIEILSRNDAGAWVAQQHCTADDCPNPTPVYGPVAGSQYPDAEFKRITHIRPGVPTEGMIEVIVQVLWWRGKDKENTNTGYVYNPLAESYDGSGTRPSIELRQRIPLH